MNITIKKTKEASKKYFKMNAILHCGLVSVLVVIIHKGYERLNL